MNRSSHRRIIALAIAAGISSAIANGQTNVHRYRYELWTRSQDPTFANEVPPDAAGRYYSVETDPQGRIARVAVIRDGKKISEDTYYFGPGEKAANASESFRGSEKTRRTKIQRNATGEITREDYYTVAGVLTGYALYSYRIDSVVKAAYTAEGKRKTIFVCSYSPKGTLAHSIVFSNPNDQNFHNDVDYDDSTGLMRLRKQFTGGKLDNSGLFTYNANGDEIRQDVYNAAGKRYATTESADGLVTKRMYAVGEEARFTYDDKRLLKETVLFYKGAFVCRFVYDRLPDGTVKRTLALGPQGDLWAEYPDQCVVDVRRDGSPITGEPAIIHKKANWY
jgi:hypothetical protein